MWLTRISINNPVMTTMLMAALIVLGLLSLTRLPIDQFPDMAYPVVVVRTDYPGASSETVEVEITRRVEEAINSVSGIRSLSSRSDDGVSLVTAEFELTMDGARAAQEVREKLAVLRAAFRKEIRDPLVTRVDPADKAVVSIAISNSAGARARSMRELTAIAEQAVKTRLENVQGVGAVSLVGGVRREINIYVKPEQMESLGVGIDQLVQAVRDENQELPAGVLRSSATETVVQVSGRIIDPLAFGRIVVAHRGGQPVVLAQVADVVDGQQEQLALAQYNGRQTLALDVFKVQGHNTIEVTDGIRRAMAELAPVLNGLYPGVRLDVIRDDSRQIRLAVENVRSTLIEGMVLTVLIVFLFLDSWRSTVITALTLPVALIGTLLFMHLFGFTINLITLMALSLCVGLLIDDAIIVRENIVRHSVMLRDTGRQRNRRASLEGTREIGLAVLATTLSIVAVFLPVGYMGGIIGRFFHQFALTVAAALCISMFVAFTLDPMLSSVWPEPERRDGKKMGYRGVLDDLAGATDALVAKITRFYLGTLSVALRNRGKTMGFAALSVVVGLAIPTMGLVGTEFVPAGDYSETAVSFRTPPGSSLAMTQAKLRQVEASLRELPEVRDLYSIINDGVGTGTNEAVIFVRLVARAAREDGVSTINTLVRERINAIGGITLTHVGTLDRMGGDSKQIRLSLQGPDLTQLARLADRVRADIKAIRGVVDIDSSLMPTTIALTINPRREVSSHLGVAPEAIGAAVHVQLTGASAGTWRAPDNENYDVTVRLPPSMRKQADDLNRLMVTSSQVSNDGSIKLISLRQVADIKPAASRNHISRRDMMHEVELSANITGRAPGAVGEEVQQVLKRMNLPAGYRFTFIGTTKNMQESATYATFALALGALFIYMILASQFQSFLQPLVIMSSVPLTSTGAFVALWLFGSTINLFSVIGLIMLMGLVTKNAILLVDFANRARCRTVSAGNAMLQALEIRLRPILMTTLATIFGMVPLALSQSEGAEQRAPMAQVVIGGLVTSSLLTLVVVPVLYTYLEDAARWLSRRATARAERY